MGKLRASESVETPELGRHLVEGQVEVDNGETRRGSFPMWSGEDAVTGGNLERSAKLSTKPKGRYSPCSKRCPIHSFLRQNLQNLQAASTPLYSHTFLSAQYPLFSQPLLFALD